MRSLEELINKEDPAWPLVQEWIESATHTIEVLPVEKQVAEDALLHLQVTTRSPMGAIVYETGGIFVDHGWIRILGAGHPKMQRSIDSWNQAGSGYLMVADDVVGGHFAINAGGLGDDQGKMYFFDPAGLRWEPMDISYSEFLVFCFEGDIAAFYQDLRWTGWEVDVQAIDGNHVFSFFPFLWTKEGENINEVSRKVITVKEGLDFQIEQMGM
ncbi:uncharacterized protein DUF2625 [Chitinophaga skermanii]|uniref:Uncharacterized protein DUF2625 n=1 Tax=Chitinophaga skermanii TaxID=331697 RepID=A0A327R388_9BACT|nr:DUF2625 domain-containing protein [Chitinophaga skermanii]RAJ11180.1 uncharacterized protein DUF2625 [Chitinophaga skermanii]